MAHWASTQPAESTSACWSTILVASSCLSGGGVAVLSQYALHDDPELCAHRLLHSPVDAHVAPHCSACGFFGQLWVCIQAA